MRYLPFRIPLPVILTATRPVKLKKAALVMRFRPLSLRATPRTESPSRMMKSSLTIMEGGELSTARPSAHAASAVIKAMRFFRPIIFLQPIPKWVRPRLAAWGSYFRPGPSGVN